MEKDEKVLTPTLNIKESSKEVRETMEELKRIDKMENPFEAMKERAKLLDKNDKKRDFKPEGFSQLLTEVSAEALKIKNLLNETEQEPRLLFNHGDELTKRRGLLQAVMNSYSPIDEELDKIRGHEFQAYLASIGNQYFQQWLNQRDIKKPFEIAVHSSGSYPSNFIIKKEGSEIYRFSLQKKWYGSMNSPLDREGIIKKNLLEMQELDKLISEINAEIEDLENRITHPFKYYKGWKNYYAILFKREFVKEQLELVVQKKKKYRDSLFKQIDKIHRNQEFEFKHGEEKAQDLGLIKPFFEEIGYTFNEDRNTMYS